MGCDLETDPPLPGLRRFPLVALHPLATTYLLYVTGYVAMLGDQIETVEHLFVGQM